MKSGEIVQASGIYEATCGVQAALSGGDRFPPTVPGGSWNVVLLVKTTRHRKRRPASLVIFRVVCPGCGWRHVWQQDEREPGQFDGLCRECGTRCKGDVPAVVRL